MADDKCNCEDARRMDWLREKFRDSTQKVMLSTNWHPESTGDSTKVYFSITMSGLPMLFKAETICQAIDAAMKANREVGSERQQPRQGNPGAGKA